MGSLCLFWRVIFHLFRISRYEIVCLRGILAFNIYFKEVQIGKFNAAYSSDESPPSRLVPQVIFLLDDLPSFSNSNKLNKVGREVTKTLIMSLH
jgi:hypothetical protein